MGPLSVHPSGFLDPGSAPGQTSPLWSLRNMSTRRDWHSFCQLVKLFSQPPRAPRRPVFCLQPEKLSPEMSHSQQDEEAPQPRASGCSPASHCPCCADRGHRNRLRLCPGSWSCRSDPQQLDSSAYPEYQWGTQGHNGKTRLWNLPLCQIGCPQGADLSPHAPSCHTQRSCRVRVLTLGAQAKMCPECWNRSLERTRTKSPRVPTERPLLSLSPMPMSQSVLGATQELPTQRTELGSSPSSSTF